MEEFSVIGKPLPQLNAKDKVMGTAAYSDDLTFPRMLYGKILRSPHPHAKIISIDTSKAEKVPGVKLAVTGADTPQIMFMHSDFPFEDKLPLQLTKVRYVGDEVAAVAAISEEIAEEAIHLINVNYELIAPIFDPEVAMKEDAPQIHTGKKNEIIQIKREFGDTDGAFKTADLVVEDIFETPAVSHCIMEPRCSVARIDEQGVLNIYSSTQSPYNVRKEIAHVLDIPVSKVRIMEINVGGGFGARSKVCEDEAITALLALKTGCPVKIAFSREEELTTTRTRLPFKIWIKQGVKKDGTLLARSVRVIADKGAYCHLGPAILGHVGGLVASFYRVPNVKYEGHLVYTNKHFGGPFRGFGAPQVTFAIESQMDSIAEKLSLDPVSLRIKNSNRSGDITPSGWKITSCGFEECIQKAVDQSNWNKIRDQKKKGDVVQGIGIACGIHLSGAKIFPEGDYSGSIVKIFEDGFVTIYKSSTDMGTWSNTIAAQIVAEALGISLEKVRVISMDTETTPIDSGSFASKVTFIHGNAAKKAAEIVREKLLGTVADSLEIGKEDLQVKEGEVFVKGTPTLSMTYGEAVKKSKDRICNYVSGEYHYDPPSELINRQTGISNISAAYTFAAQVAVVEVNKRTGQVQVKGYFAAQDVGRAINPLAVEGQLQGAILQGIGFALSEKYVYNDGTVLNANFTDYKMPTVKDTPLVENMRTIIIETNDPEGPFGAKGVGELPLNPTAAAISNAIYNAIGARFKALPIVPEEILEALS